MHKLLAYTFYTTDVGDKTSKIIKIEETTAPAFQIVIDVIYHNKFIGDILKDKSVHEVFDVINVIERYQITELMEAAKEFLANYPVTNDTVLEVAGEAMEYTTLFQSEAKNLLLACAKFLMPKVKNFKFMVRYAAENQDRKEVFATLLGLMNGMAPAECHNCKYQVYPVLGLSYSVCSAVVLFLVGCGCVSPVGAPWVTVVPAAYNQTKPNQTGKGIKHDEFREGLMVTNNSWGVGWGTPDYGTGKVTEVAASRVTVKSVKPGVSQNNDTGHQFDDSTTYYTGPRNYVAFFLFSCN